MELLRLLWLGLALWGTVHPMSFFLGWFDENGYDLMAMVNAWHVNAATSGLVWDLTIAAITLTLWILYESVTHREWRYLTAIPATFMIGMSCGLPLFLYFRLQNQSS